MGEGAWLLLMMLFGKWSPKAAKPRAFRLVYQVSNDAGAQRVLAMLERTGSVPVMHLFDGKWLDVDWVPKDPKVGPPTKGEGFLLATANI